MSEICPVALTRGPQSCASRTDHHITLSEIDEMTPETLPRMRQNGGSGSRAATENEQATSCELACAEVRSRMLSLGSLYGLGDISDRRGPRSCQIASQSPSAILRDRVNFEAGREGGGRIAKAGTTRSLRCCKPTSRQTSSENHSHSTYFTIDDLFNYFYYPPQTFRFSTRDVRSFGKLVKIRRFARLRHHFG